ncbi:hypothetical protein LTR56_027990 [Elasticomyces elasticus]|nr:hypothetical protein LTR56_027990 [Elasticomyces elasticus]KAK4904508.1 hypothetical protein LTR49_026049 [Elasticomyces elasticus]
MCHLAPEEAYRKGTRRIYTTNYSHVVSNEHTIMKRIEPVLSIWHQPRSKERVLFEVEVKVPSNKGMKMMVYTVHKSRTESEVSTTPVTPVTPVAPVSAASFAALQDTIIKGYACTLDEVNKQKFKRHTGKLAKAAQVSLARNALQEDHIRSLLKINDEAKSQRSARPIILSTAKVISYEDPTAAYAQRAEQQEKASARKKKLEPSGPSRKRREKLSKAESGYVVRSVRADHRGREIVSWDLKQDAEATGRI